MSFAAGPVALSILSQPLLMAFGTVVDVARRGEVASFKCSFFCDET